ncbi:MAG: efflux RND transporter periplasmic adaptor subunit [Gammaproteobacteria bacterium]|nr:efflux RND transporter periplasmic adaptor subunit [Gammaproteobacteria bacterium]
MKKLPPDIHGKKTHLPFIHLLFISLLQCICLTNSFAQDAPETLVSTAEISIGTLQTEQIFIGSIHFSQSSLLASKTQGMVLKVNFDTTQLIQQGDVLVELDHEILDSQIRAVQASLKELKLLEEKSAKDLKRYKKLVQQKNVSQQKYDEIYYDKIRIDQKLISSNAELEALLIERKQHTISAPFSGIITERYVELGEWVDKGGKIATLVNPQAVTSIFNLPASYALEIKPQQKIQVHTGKQSINGTIEGVIIKGDNKSRTFPLKIKLHSDNAVLFDGMETQIKLPRKSSEGLLVPRDAIIKRFGNNVIFIVDNHTAKTTTKMTAKMVPVIIHLYSGSMASISAREENEKELLQAGLKVITKGNERVFPGQTLQVK